MYKKKKLSSGVGAQGPKQDGQTLDFGYIKWLISVQVDTW